MTDPNSAKKSAPTVDNPTAANPNAPAEVILDPSDPAYLAQRQKLAADEAREGQEKAAKLREANALGTAVITAQGVVTNPEDVATATPASGAIPGAVPGVGGVTVSESVNTTRTVPESGVRRSTNK